jgi:hypothetical protein
MALFLEMMRGSEQCSYFVLQESTGRTAPFADFHRDRLGAGRAFAG